MRAPRPGLVWRLVAVTLAALAALLIYRLTDSFDPRIPRSSLLSEEILRQRLTLLRLTGGFEYAPFVEEGKALERPPQRDQPDRAERGVPGRRLRAARQSEGQDPASLAAQATLVIAEARTPETLKQAIRRLEAAHLAAPADAAILSNLSALTYSLAETLGEPIGRVRALALVDRALALAPELLEARFNRALCLEALGLWPAAEAAWEDYLELDSGSGWAEEARARLAAAADPGGQAVQEALPRILEAARNGEGEEVVKLMEDFRSAARRHLEEEVLRSWGAAHLAGREQEAREAVQVARALATAYEELTGDGLYGAAVSAIEGAAAAADLHRLSRLALGHRLFGEAEAIRLPDTEAALDRFLEAWSALRDAGSPFAERAFFKAGVCMNRLQRHDEALPVFRSVGARAREERHWNLLAECLWMEGLTLIQTRHLAEGQHAYQRALAVFEQLGDPESLLGIQNLIAETHLALGDPQAAWRALEAPLLAKRRVAVPNRLYQIYANAAHAALQAGYPEVGIEFSLMARGYAEAANDPLALAQADHWLGRLRLRAGRREDARRSLEEAEGSARRIRSEAERARVAADLRTLEAEIVASDDPAAAAEELSAALLHYRARGYRLTEATTLLALGRAHLGARNEMAAEAALAEAAIIWESDRGTLSFAAERISLFGLAEGTFDELIALELRRGLPDRALEWSERRRARELLEQFTRAGGEAEAPHLATRPLSPAELLAGLPADRSLIEFALVDGRLSAWLLQAGTPHWLPLTDDARPLEHQIRLLRSELQLGLPTGGKSATAAALYDLLLRPVLALVPEQTPLILVPEGRLENLPFAALWDRETDLFLIERHPFAVAPSGSLYVAASERARSLPDRAEPTAFSIGRPAYDEGAYSGLGDLGYAELEAVGVAQLYPPSELVLGSDATASRFLASAGQHEVVHFAGHALANSDAAFRSRLLFAAETGDPEHGALVASELTAATLPETRLVFLSACSTLGGPLLKTEGVANLARPFLAAGVPAVVGTLWNVEDRSAYHFAIAFHERLARGEAAILALREAQLALLHGDDASLREPGAWAAFQLVGEAQLGIVPSP